MSYLCTTLAYMEEKGREMRTNFLIIFLTPDAFNSTYALNDITWTYTLVILLLNNNRVSYA